CAQDDNALDAEFRMSIHTRSASKSMPLWAPIDLGSIDFTLKNADVWRDAAIVKNVLFVCTGNICRSPIAEGLFRQMIGNRKDIDVASAGVHAVRDQPPSLYAVQVCADNGVDISGLRSQPLTTSLVERATHIFAMTGAQLETI